MFRSLMALGGLLVLLAAAPARATDAPDFALDAQLEFLPDPAGQWTVDDLQREPLAQQFRRNPRDTAFEAGYTRVPHWFRVTLPNEIPPGDWLLEIGYPLLDYVDIYLPLAEGGFRKIETGDQRPFAGRALKHRNFVETLHLAPGASRTLYLRIETQSSLQIPLHLWSSRAFIEKSQLEQYLLGFYYGIILVMFLYNLGAGLLVRDVSYAYYICYLLASGVLQAGLNGLTTQYLFGASAYWANTRVLPLAFAAGVLTAAIPVLCSFLLTRLLVSLEVRPSAWGMAALAYAVAVFAGAWIFGAYLALLTRIGVEHTQAFSALDHPGFKHFLRLRVRVDGSSIDGWCIGLVDPLKPGDPPVLVDQFSFRPEQTKRPSRS